MPAEISGCETLEGRKKERKKEGNKATTLMQKHSSVRFIGVGGEVEELVARCASLSGGQVERFVVIE